MTPLHAKPDTIVGDGLLPIPEAARWLGVGRTTLYALMSSGILPWVKLRGRRLIPRRALIELAGNNLKGGEA